MQYRKLPNWQKIAQLKPLSDLSTPPEELYYIGNFDPDIFKECAAVVGSRRMTDYGARVVEKLVPGLVIQGKTIVSGFMYGIDQHAHEMTVNADGKTIAVLGYGINTRLEGKEAKLAEKIISAGGLLISEWEDQKAALWTFPSRNRIIAALSSEVIVVEAAEKSGSLITASLALKLKRKLWAVPGPITSRTSRGTNRLIAQGKAQMWLENTPGVGLDSPGVNDPILEILLSEALSADEIARKLQMPVSETGVKLSLLLLSGQVIERAGKYYVNQD